MIASPTSLRRAGLLAALLVAAPAAAQERRDDRRDERVEPFEWSGPVAAGRTLYLKNLNGGVTVERASGREVEIEARKRVRRGDPEFVRITVTRSDDGDVVACGLWGPEASCDERDYRSRNDNRGWSTRNNEISVEFTVRVPEGVRLDLSTVNGTLDIDGATDAVKVSTVNGAIRASSLGGPVTANTVNGSITVRMGDAGREDLRYSTVNGSITIEVPDGLDADLQMSTVNGSIDSDFPLTLRGRINPKSIRATIGDGGRALVASTVNGSVRLRRRN